VKVLSKLAGESDAEWLGRRNGLLQEAQNLARAQHRNVVQVHHLLASEDGLSVRFCMALCGGGSLMPAYVRGPMALSAVRKIATEVTLGLQALHQRGMLHRDIKPANILLDNRDVALLGDFGLVTDRLLMGYGSLQGYSDHLAYELWHGEPTSQRSDIWALGMTLYRLIHGQRWYERHAGPRDVIANGGFVDTLRWLPSVPKKWRRVLRKMMSDDTKARYQNCEELLRAFAALPIEPDWSCDVDEGTVSWSRTAGQRELHVEWTQHSPRKHEWSARSLPVGAGRPRLLDGSKEPISAKICITELERFFGV